MKLLWSILRLITRLQILVIRIPRSRIRLMVEPIGMITITIPTGSYDIDDINDVIQRGMKSNGH